MEWLRGGNVRNVYDLSKMCMLQMESLDPQTGTCLHEDMGL